MSQENTYTKEVELPISKAKVVIKTMITGREKEFIETADARVTKVGPNNQLIAKPDEVMMAPKHALIDTYVVTINGSNVDCRKKVLDMMEDDYDAVMLAIDEAKKKSPTQESETD